MGGDGFICACIMGGDGIVCVGGGCEKSKAMGGDVAINTQHIFVVIGDKCKPPITHDATFLCHQCMVTNSTFVTLISYRVVAWALKNLSHCKNLPKRKT